MRIRVFLIDGIIRLTLFVSEKYDAIYSRLRYLISQKIDITYTFSKYFAKVKVKFMIFLPTEKKHLLCIML